jgi:hypothetical protein
MKKLGIATDLHQGKKSTTVIFTSRLPFFIVQKRIPPCN